MLRLPPFDYHRPGSVEEAVELLDRHGGDAMPVAGGTDVMPNMKHRLHEPGHLVGLKGIPELTGVERENGEVVVGATETLTEVATNGTIRAHFPSLAEAAGNVAGPQLRNMGTIGGNLCLDTRCTYYNQTEQWREALGYCLKKDGDTCHVTGVGTSCVAAHSADTPPVLMVLEASAELAGPGGSPVLMVLEASAELAGPGGRRELPVREFFTSDGEWNQKRDPEEIVTRIRIPVPDEAVRTGYAKLRQRKSVDFPLLTVAVLARTAEGGTVEEIRGVVTGLGARPRVLTGWEPIAVGERLDDEVVEALAEKARAQCHPLENRIEDAEWREAMVGVYTRKALEKLPAV